MFDNRKNSGYLDLTVAKSTGGCENPLKAVTISRQYCDFFSSCGLPCYGGLYGAVARLVGCRFRYSHPRMVYHPTVRSWVVDFNQSAKRATIMNVSTLAVSAIPQLTVIDGTIKTTSLDIAKIFGKFHKDVLRKIQNLNCSPEFNERNFTLVEFLDNKGEKQPSYEITRDGFAFLCMGFTGAKAAQFKEAYINAFNAMEAQLTPVQPRIGKTTVQDRTALRNAVNLLVSKAHVDYSIAYDMVNGAFGTEHIEDIPKEKLTEAVRYVHGLVGEYIPKEQVQTDYASISVSRANFMHLVSHASKLVALVDDLMPALRALRYDRMGAVVGHLIEVKSASNSFNRRFADAFAIERKEQQTFCVRQG